MHVFIIDFFVLSLWQQNCFTFENHLSMKFLTMHHHSIYLCWWIGWQGGSALAPDYRFQKGWVFSRWKAHNVSWIKLHVRSYTLHLFFTSEKNVVFYCICLVVWVFSWILKIIYDLQKNWSDEFAGECWVLPIKSLLCCTTRKGIGWWWQCLSLVWDLLLYL